MKRLHRPDLFAWSIYDEGQQVDFNGLLWKREGGNVVVDPVPLADHDWKHLVELGGAAWIVVTNSSHVRAAREVAARTGAALLGPAGERESFPVPCGRWLADGDEPVPGLVVRELHGSKTDGELALVSSRTPPWYWRPRARAPRRCAHAAAPREASRPARALESLCRFRRLHPRIEHVLVGDGWCAFRNGGVLLDELLPPGWGEGST